MIKIGVYGANGRIGKKLVEYLKSEVMTNISLGYAYSRSDAHASLDDLFTNSDIIIDFSSPEGLSNLIELCKIHNMPLISGTTGINDYINIKLQDASKIIPIFYSPNMSVGANLIGMMASSAVKHLPKEYDIEIIDIHHKTKKDAPAGTAIQIEKMINTASIGHEVHITSIRTGNNPGEYHILFSGFDETITISHTVTSKMPYVIGACNVAIWLHNRKAGLYNMLDILK